MSETETTPEEWAIVEIMGHHQSAGRIQEVTRFGAQLLRVDRPDKDGGFHTEFYGGQAIYRLRHCTEEIARRYAVESLYDDRPIRPMDYREPVERPALEVRADFAGSPTGYRNDDDDEIAF